MQSVKMMVDPFDEALLCTDQCRIVTALINDKIRTAEKS